MRRQIRKNVFETNSSSVHAIVIPKADPAVETLHTDDMLIFEPGTFNWGCEELRTPESRASYLYTSIVCNEARATHEGLTDSQLEKIKPKTDRITEFLGRHGIEAEFIPWKWHDRGRYYFVADAYELTDFIQSVLASDECLMRYLYSKRSVVYVGNDNSKEECPKYDITDDVDVWGK